MKLGACYNLFDAEELLEFSVQSIRKNVDYICVVYQTTSNWGNKANPHLEEFLKDLKERGIIDEIIFYEPTIYPIDKKREMVSKYASEQEIGGSVDTISDVFFNELSKREIGRRKCKEHGCTYFMSMDSDEFYLEDQLKKVKQEIEDKGYEGVACRMRTFFKEPTCELLPPDSMNAVPVIYQIKEDSEFKLAVNYHQRFNILLDPTRRLENIEKFHLFERSELEMYHYSFVRRNIKMKMDNVSNKHNYQGILSFLQKWETWTPDKGVLHPHPLIGKMFQHIGFQENIFGIDLSAQCPNCSKLHDLKRCGRCKKVKYCSAQCQKEDWNKHKEKCIALK